MTHYLVRAIKDNVPNDLQHPTRPKDSPFSVKQDDLLSPALAAFHYGIVGYLALNNMVALANDKSLIERLLGYSTKGFKDWLDKIDIEGPVI